jgi:uncharacterized protein (DUF924 family)
MCTMGALWGGDMPFADFLGDQKFDPETKRVMGLAFEMARAAVYRDWTNKADALLAKRIIELAKAGERNPDTLCDEALKTFRPRAE